MAYIWALSESGVIWLGEQGSLVVAKLSESGVIW